MKVIESCDAWNGGEKVSEKKSYFNLINGRQIISRFFDLFEVLDATAQK